MIHHKRLSIGFQLNLNSNSIKFHSVMKWAPRMTCNNDAHIAIMKFIYSMQYDATNCKMKRSKNLPNTT